MSEQNHEERIAALELKIFSIERELEEKRKAMMLQSQQITNDRQSIGGLLHLILQLHPELQNPKIMGLIHITDTSVEFTADGLEKLIEKLKRLPPPGY